LVIEFSEATTPSTNQDDGRWTRSLTVLRRILMTLLADAGTDILPFADGPRVRAIKSETVRGEFYKQYATTDTDPKKQQEARSKAYRRAIHTAQQREVIAIRELDGIEWVWLARAQQ
jgi:hypothetical protein